MEGLFLLNELLIVIAAIGIGYYFQRKEKKQREKIREEISELKNSIAGKGNASLTKVNSVLDQCYSISKPRCHQRVHAQSWSDETGHYLSIDLLHPNDSNTITAQVTALLKDNTCVLKVFVFANIFEGVELLKELQARGGNREIIEVEHQVSRTMEAFNDLLQFISI